MLEGVEFTAKELELIARHRIAADELARKDTPAAAKAVVVVGYGPACGHRLMTRAGKCIECNPAAIHFQREHEREKYVYVLHSPARGLVKIGSTVDVHDRVRRLNVGDRSSAMDWTLEDWVRCPRAGDVEQLALRLLRGWLGVKRGQDGLGYEEVRATVDDGIAALAEALRVLKYQRSGFSARMASAEGTSAS